MWATTTAITWSTVQGTTRRFSIAGALTDGDAHGFKAINPSSTAAVRMADRLTSMIRTDDGAECSRLRSHAWTPSRATGSKV
ncbi:MAG TPA: hypothetical protein VM848_14325 [Acidimicrobiia bacterium]|nr:hypothetical protein [Acidimicrobiia bacterium]